MSGVNGTRPSPKDYSKVTPVAGETRRVEIKPDGRYWVIDRFVAWLCIFVTFCAGFAVGAALMSLIILH